MIFTTPLGLLALLAIPAIIVIHLFRRRFPPRPVAGLFLWQLIRMAPEGGGRVERPPVTKSLVLECLAALALALILAGARCSPSSISQHLVVLLDDSASMGAIGGGGEGVRDRAIRRVQTEIDALGSGARVTLVRSGERPSVLIGPAAIALEAPAALAGWQPVAAHHSLALGLRLARELAGTTGELLVITDLAPAARGEAHFEGGRWLALGEAIANVGITAAQRTLAPDHSRDVVALTLANFGDAPATRRLTITAADKEILARDIDVPAGNSSITLPLPAGLSAIRVALSDDSLARDNAVELAAPRPRIVGVANSLPDGRGREALTKALSVVAGVTPSAAPDLAFVEARTLDQPLAAGRWRVGLGEPPAAWTAPGEMRDLIGPFVLEKRHPLILGMTLAGVVWPGARAIVPGRVHPLVSADAAALLGIPSGADDATTGLDVLVNLDLDRTNLVRAPDWPILVSNVVEWRRQHLPGPERWNYRAGEWIRVRLGREPAAPLRFVCGTVERELPASRNLEFIAPSPGGLLRVFEGDAQLYEVGVNFLDAQESDLRAQSTLDAGARTAAAGLRAESGPASDPLFWVLLAAGAIAIGWNWGLVGRRLQRG